MHHEGKERRAHPRYDVKNLTGSIFFSMEAKVINQSINGATLETTKSLGSDNEYTLEVMYNERLIELKGKMVWCTLDRYVKNEQGEVIPIFKGDLKFMDIEDERVPPESNEVKINYQRGFIIKSISLSGIMIELDMPIEMESLIEMDIKLDDQILTCNGKIVRSYEEGVGPMKKYFFGIQFITMSEESKKILSSYISRLANENNPSS